LFGCVGRFCFRCVAQLVLTMSVLLLFRSRVFLEPTHAINWNEQLWDYRVDCFLIAIGAFGGMWGTALALMQAVNGESVE